MGRAILTANVEERAKAAISEAVLPILGENGSMTQLVEKIGFNLQSELERLQGIYGDALPSCDLGLHLTPKN